MAGNEVVRVPAARGEIGGQQNYLHLWVNRLGCLYDLLAAAHFGNHHHCVYKRKFLQQLLCLARAVGGGDIEFCCFYHQLAHGERLVRLRFNHENCWSDHLRFRSERLDASSEACAATGCSNRSTDNEAAIGAWNLMRAAWPNHRHFGERSMPSSLPSGADGAAHHPRLGPCYNELTFNSTRTFEQVLA